MWTILILTVLTWILFSLLSGYSEAGYWYYKYNGDALKLPKYEHNIWTVMRGILLFNIFILYFIMFEWYAFFGVISLACVFPYFHDGMYYYQRNEYDGSYPDGWKSFSKTSTAKIKIDYMTRVFMAAFLGSLFMLAMISEELYLLFN